jgi:hypothetical protein
MQERASALPGPVSVIDNLDPGELMTINPAGMSSKCRYHHEMLVRTN